MFDVRRCKVPDFQREDATKKYYITLTLIMSGRGKKVTDSEVVLTLCVSNVIVWFQQENVMYNTLMSHSLHFLFVKATL